MSRLSLFQKLLQEEKDKTNTFGEMLWKMVAERNKLEEELEALKEKYNDLLELYNDYDSPYERDE